MMENQQPKIWTPEQLNDPVWFIEYFFNCELWEKQKEIALSVFNNRITAVRSCFDSGKSFIAARLVGWFLETNKDSKVITTAPGWIQVREILWNEIHSAYNSVKDINPKFSFSGRILETKIDKSPDWFAIGLATKQETDVSEVAQRMLGFHSRTGKILIIVDEAAGVHRPIWGAIEGLMTSEYVKLLAVGQPFLNTGGFADLFKRKDVSKIHIRDEDIPNIKENRIIYPGLMSPSYPKEMEAKYGKDSNLFLIKVKGEFPRSETDTLIPIDQIEASFLRELEPTGEKKLGVDVARFGHNFTVLLVRQGNKVLRKDKYSKEDTMETSGRVLRIMEEENIKDTEVFIDDIGVGGGVVDRLREQEHNVNGVNVGAVAEDPEHYSNIRAESYWAIREWIKTAQLPKDEDFYQLSNIKYKWKADRKGLLAIESKEEMSKRGLESPDVADALMLTFAGSSPSPFPDQDTGAANPNVERASKPLTAGLLDKVF